jgi:hypothetical protein
MAVQPEIRPFSFRDMDVRRPGYQSERLYALLHSTFGDDELESQRDLERGLNRTLDRRNHQPRLVVARIGLLARRWRWKLVEPVVAGVVSGEYLSLSDVGRPSDGIGALGHLVTHPQYGRGGGHGGALTSAFEQRVIRAAGSVSSDSGSCSSSLWRVHVDSGHTRGHAVP